MISTLALTNSYVRGTLFCAEAGLSVESAINRAIEHSLSGLELLGGLPGSIGAAVWGNASSLGVAISSLIEWIDYLDDKGSLHRYHYKEGDFSYKNSPFKGQNVTLYEVALRLIYNKNSSEAHLTKEKSRAKRIEEGQFATPCAGCIFKNPKGVSAGSLIDQANLKGFTIGGAEVSHNHANFIINPNYRATSSEIYSLALLVAQKVEEVHNITLEREIVLLGRW